MITTIIVVAFVLLIYWALIKDGKYKQGVGELKNGDPIKASYSFNDVIIKNPNHYKAEFHMGICKEQMAGLYTPTDKRNLELKNDAIKHFLRASEIKLDFLQPNNRIEILICSEKDDNLKQGMIAYAKKQIDTSSSNLKEQYSWLFNF